MTATEQPFPSDWLRGVLGLAVLRILAEGPTYGYAISVELERHGFGTIKGGTLYPLLGRFEEADYVDTQWRQGESGPGRKYYELTESGNAALSSQAELWERFASRVASLLANPATTTPSEETP